MKKLTNIKVLREKNGYTREEVAEILGISINTYNSYEWGSRKPKLERIRQLAKLFKCTMEDLTKEGEYEGD